MLEFEAHKPEKFTDLIERIWTVENTGEDVEVNVPPNQYVSIIFPIGDSYYERNGVRIDSAQIEGIALKTSYLKYPEGTRLVGIRFFAFGLFPFFRLSGKELIDRSILLPSGNFKRDEQPGRNDIIGQIYQMLDGLFNQDAYKKMWPIIDFYSAFRWNGVTTIEAHCVENGTNYTSLNRRFSHTIGLSPKKFERLIKFRKSLCNLIDSDESLTAISIDSGYFDQAHFIREFKLFIDQTPKTYLDLIKTADKQSQIINYNFRIFR